LKVDFDNWGVRSVVAVAVLLAGAPTLSNAQDQPEPASADTPAGVEAADAGVDELEGDAGVDEPDATDVVVEEPVATDELGAKREASDDRVADPAAVDDDRDVVDGDDPIVVTGTRLEEHARQATVATTVITREQLEASGSETLAEALEEINGIEIVPGVAGQVVRVRGLDPQHTLILVDGDRVIGRVDGGVDLSRLQVEDIERIEIVRSGSSAAYGSEASGGVIQIVTRRAERRLEAGLHSTAGLLGTRESYGIPWDLSGSLGTARTRGSAQLTLGAHRLPSFSRPNAEGATVASEILELNGEGRAVVRFRANHALRLRLRSMRRDTDGVDVSSSSAVFDRTNRVHENVLSLASEHRFGDRHRLELHLAGTTFRDQYRSDQRNGPMDTFQDTREQIVELRSAYRFAPSREHEFALGVDSMLERLDTPRISEIGLRGRAAPYAEYRYRYDGDTKVSVVPGIRADADSQFGRFVSPKLSIRVDPHESVGIRASIGRGFRAPSFRELYLLFENPSVGYVVVGNPELRPERSFTVDLGVSYEPLRRLGFELTLFRAQLDGMITTTDAPSNDPTSMRYSYTNLDRATTQGVELQSMIRPIRGMTLDLGYVFLDARDRSNDRPIAGRSRHRGTLRLQYRHRASGAGFVVRAALASKRPYDDGSDGVDYAPAWVSLDARYEQSIGNHVSVFVGADNLANAGDARLPIRPRGVYAGLDLRL